MSDAVRWMNWDYGERSSERSRTLEKMMKIDPKKKEYED